MLSILSTLSGGTVNCRYKIVSGQPPPQFDMLSAFIITTRLNCKLFWAFAKQQQSNNRQIEKVFFMIWKDVFENVRSGLD